MSENSILIVSLMISSSVHFLLLSLPFNFSLQCERPEMKSMMIAVEILRPQLLPRVDKLGPQKELCRTVKRPEKGSKVENPASDKSQLSLKKLEEREETKKPGNIVNLNPVHPNPEAILRYQDMVKQKIEEQRSYPLRARENGGEGISVCKFAILPNGQVTGIELMKSSGYSALDEKAKKMIDRASPFAPPPKDLNSHLIQMKIAIAFKLR